MGVPRTRPQLRSRRGTLAPARAAVGVALIAVGLACHKPGPPPKFTGSPLQPVAAGVDPGSPAERSWSDLLAARQADPAAAEVVGLAQALLDSDPPPAGRLAAWAALAEQSYLIGDDATAATWAEQGLSQLQSGPALSNPDTASALRADLAGTHLRALARGGDPIQALTALGDPNASGALDEEARLGLRAVALDRNADAGAAVVAYLQWRQALSDDDPSAPWAEHRARVLAARVPVTELAEAANNAVGEGTSPVHACLAARMGGPAPTSKAPAWAQRCASNVERIGIMLPRTGPLSALADTHLVAALAASDVLGARHGEVEILWEDPGSSAKGTRKAVRALKAMGADVIVGPLGSKLVGVAAREAGDSIPIVVPGEGRGVARGVAPSLEARVEALVKLAKAAEKHRLVILAPDNAYGRRAVAAAKRYGGRMKYDVVARQYEAGTTSFAKTLKPITTALSHDSALLLADHLSRAEMVVRQLARIGKVPSRDDTPGLMVMTTAEGASDRALRDAGSTFEGVWAAPVATPVVAGPTGVQFASAYARGANTLPGDQAMLVYYAMHMAFTGRAAKGSGYAPLVRVVQGEFVPAATGEDGS